MVRAGQGMFGSGFNANGVEFSGRLDPLIIHDLLTANGVGDASRADRETFADQYRRILEHTLSESPAQTLPGVYELLDQVQRRDAWTMGLLTGNFEASGSVKLRSAGIDPSRFPVRVWGDLSPYDPPARDHLPPVGLEQFEACRGRRLPPEQAVIIGDTPHDIACGRAHGLRTIAVATGRFGRDELDHADLVLDTLEATETVLDWLSLGETG